MDAILLAGFHTNSILQQQLIQGVMVDTNGTGKNNVKNSADNVNFIDEQGSQLFSMLPYEIVVYIFQYLDLKSLTRCARVNKRWNQIAADPFFYTNLNFKPYWYLFRGDTLMYFMDKCKMLKCLDLSWCGKEDVECFTLYLSSILKENVKSLTHLTLGDCSCYGEKVFEDISKCGQLVDLRMKYFQSNVVPQFRYFDSLTKLVSLDLTSTDICDEELIRILKSNPNLKHLIIDLCELLIRLDDVVKVVSEFNKSLRTWSSWKTLSLTEKGVRYFGKCQNLIDLDLGWCLINKHPENCLEYVSEGCPNLKRLILSEWTGLNDFLLEPIITKCKELSQLDFLGIPNITSDFCLKVLMGLPKLKLLDLRYNDYVSYDEVLLWREIYPGVTIQSTVT